MNGRSRCFMHCLTRGREFVNSRVNCYVIFSIETYLPARRLIITKAVNHSLLRSVKCGMINHIFAVTLVGQF